VSDYERGLDPVTREDEDTSTLYDAAPPAPYVPAPRDEPDAPDAPASVGRRDALRMLGLAPVFASLGWNVKSVEKAVRFVGALPEASEDDAYVTKFFTPREWRTVRMLADYIIPRDDRSGSATDARAPEFVDFMLMDAETSDADRLAMRGGLAWLDTESRRRFGANFVAATDAQRRSLLDDIAWPKKAPPGMSAGVAFFNDFRDAIASGFYSSAMGWKDLQYVGNVFNPNWNGCPEPALRKLGVSYAEYDAALAAQRGS
jgi:gluconate 2-dehydrogenase gamma chain